MSSIPATDRALGLSRETLRGLLRIDVIASVAVFAVASVLVPLGAEIPLSGWPGGLALMVVSSCVMIAADVAAIRWVFRPVARALEAGREVPRGDAVRALVRALNFPVLTAARVVIVHFGTLQLTSAVLFGLFGSALGVPRDMPLWPTTVTLGLMLTAGHALFEYFAVVPIVRPVLPALWGRVGELSEEERAGIVTIGTERKLALVSSFVVLVPLGTLAVTLLQRFFGS